ncbi:unnamed protein product [Rhizoctonia solani]|uniref:Uncharacterized protein n=1 Tax=Rhizoctonia solani TaxID=456999 RepID=A0A8H2W7E1_9AGAM|nr:unnamed protein product [Rhizoctonia solani]
MPPIVSPKILSQIVMNGCTAELSKASYVQVIHADLKARPVAICKPIVLIVGSVIPRQRRVVVPYTSRASYTSLPNSLFILDPEETFTDIDFTSEEVPITHSSEILSASTIDSNNECSSQLERAISDSEPTNLLEVCPETEPVITCVSSSPSTISSTSSVLSNFVPPSTTATSVPPWGSSKRLVDPLQKFGAPPATSYARSCSPVDSLDIIRHRRASEAVGASPPRPSVPHVRKYSDVRGLRGLGLRGLDIFKRFKW